MKYEISWSATLESGLADMEAFLPAVEVNENTSNSLTMQTPSEMRSAKASGKTDFANNKLDSGKSTDEKTNQDYVKEFTDKLDRLKDRSEQTKSSVTRIVQTTNRGNEDLLSKVKHMTAQESINAVNWTYGHDPNRYLHLRVVKMRQVIKKALLDIQKPVQDLAEDSILVIGTNSIEEHVMHDIGAPSSITTYKEFISWTQAQFRGKKSEKTFHNSDVSKFVRDMEQFARVENVINQDLAEVERYLSTMKARLQNQFSSSTVENDMKQMFMKRVDRCGKLIMMYINMVNMTYRLHTEFILNRRAIVRRLYAQ